MTFIDLCAGIGGGKLGLEALGLKPVAYSEIDKNAIKAYDFLHMENVPNLGDLMQISMEKIKPIDMLIAGFPCQTFSIVGKRQGVDDDRGKVIFGIFKILKYKQPSFFILENVKGLLSIDKGETLKNIVKELEMLNYNVFYKTLDSVNYGVPQSRERVYFIGVRKDITLKYNFPIAHKEKYKKEDFLIDNRSEFLLENHTEKLKTFIKYLGNKYNNNKYTLDMLKALPCYTFIDTRQSDIRIFKDHCPTLRKGRHGILYVKNGHLRYLSGVEAIKLQGFPDDIVRKAQYLSNTIALSLAGNAMTVTVIKALASSLFNTKDSVTDDK